MEINTFKDLAEQRNFNEQTLEGIETRLRRGTRNAEFAFTDLQTEAFNTPGFWREDFDGRIPPHMIIQGATSSGKTLVSEMAIIECLTHKPKRSAIILVPLKAMVRERRDRLEQDLPGEKVFASSSDFQDHDAEIINDKFDVAVIVYEKFFAMLSQPSNKILKRCSLLVVDELQMLSSEGRGAKLEVAIQKVMRHNSELGEGYEDSVYTRIMCLTTCDCKTDYIFNWLTVNKKTPLVIKSTSRPVGLEEFILQTDGTLIGRYTFGQRDDPSLENSFEERSPKKLVVDGYSENNRYDTQKNQVLYALLKHIYRENPDAKVLVFVSDRKKTVDIAKNIAAQGILPRVSLSDGILQKLDGYESDEARTELQKLLAYRIGFHNSSLSTALREFIEKMFAGIPDELDDRYIAENSLNLVVATETLTVGMNMPVDVMILFDHTVPRGDVVAELTSQEYKNFVGRAGRLGQSNRVGQSYILAVDKNEVSQFKTQYLNCKEKNIISTPSLMMAKEEAHAPYYLGLLTADRSYNLDELNQMQRDSFASKCGGNPIKMKRMMDLMRKASLCRVKLDDDDYDAEDENYVLQEEGVLLAPFALRLDTVKRLRRYFLNAGYRMNADGELEKALPAGGFGGVPSDITAAEIEQDEYLLDLLYVICTTKELRGISQFRLPAADRNAVKNADAKNIVMTALKKMVDPDGDNPPLCRLWNKSRLRDIADNRGPVETQDLQDVMRAILLWHWTKGEKVSAIRKKTGFTRFTPIYTGDLDRMAELVAYQLEAVHNIWSFSKLRPSEGRTVRAIYHLSTRVNYGMPRNLVVIANRHLYGLDRLSVLKIGEAAVSYDSPVHFLATAPGNELKGIITEQQRGELLALIGKAAGQNALDGILERIKRDSVALSEEEASTITQLSYAEDFEPSQLKSLFWDEDSFDIDDAEMAEEKFFRGESVTIRSINDDARVATLQIHDLTVNLAFFSAGQNYRPINNRFRSRDGNTVNLLLTSDNGPLLSDLHYDSTQEVWRLGSSIENIHIAMTTEIFAALLAQTISTEDRSGECLMELLKDIRGHFNPKSVRSLYYLLQNYSLRQQGAPGESQIRILCDYRNGGDHDACDKLFHELNRRGIPFRTIPWGKVLSDERDSTEITVLYISRDSLDISKSVERFIGRMKANSYPSTIAFFENDDQYRAFSGNSALPERRFAWDVLNDPVKIAAEISAMRHFHRRKDNDAGKYLIGISYSHAPVNGQERAAVHWFRKIVQGVNHIFGEQTVLYDDNEWCCDQFDRNGAIPATLGMYEKCMYYIILDDEYYSYGPNCPREYETIHAALASRKEFLKQHIWFLRPENQRSGGLFNQNEDYCHAFRFTDESVKEIVDEIRRVITSDLA